MSWACDSSEIFSGAWLSSAYAGLGIAGSSIPTSGEHGGSPAANDGIIPGNEYRWQLVTGPEAGTLTLYEDLTFVFSGAPDGVHSFTYRLFENGADVGTGVVTMTIGAGVSAVSSDLALAYMLRQGVQSDLGVSYSVRAAAAADLALSYALRAQVQADLPLSFEILSPGVVMSDLAVSYVVRGPAAADLPLAYQILSSVGQDLPLSYSVRASAAADLALAYSVLGGVSVSADLPLAWAVVGRISVDLPIAWTVGDYVAQATVGYSARINPENYRATLRP